MRELNVEEIQGSAGLETLKSEWQTLAAACQAPPFLTWEWLSSWQETFAAQRTLRILSARAEDGKLLGIFPLNLQESRLNGLPIRVRRLSLLGEAVGGADYLDLLALPGYELDVANAFLDHLEKSDSFDLFELDGLPTDSRTLPLLTRYFADNLRYRLQIQPRDLCPQIRIDSWENVVKQCQRVTYFNRSVKRLRKLPGYELRVIREHEQIDDAFERFLRLHEMAWASRGGSGATGSADQKAFMRDVVRRLAPSGWIRFEEIWIEGSCCASLLGFENGKDFYFFLNGYDPAWSKYSLGFTLLWISLESAAQRGIKVYDQLRGSESYKFFWANSARATVKARVFSRSLPAKLMMAREELGMLTRVLAPEWIRKVVLKPAGDSKPDAPSNETPEQDGSQPGKLQPALPKASNPTYQE